jgi:hypothetical protein
MMWTEGGVLYTDRPRRAAASKAPHRGAPRGVDWWLGRTVDGALVVGGAQSARIVTLYQKGRGAYDVGLDALNRDLLAGKVDVR